KAGLRWVVATHAGELLGGETDLVRKLENSGHWQSKHVEQRYAHIRSIELCKHEVPQSETSHVIRISLKETEQTIWLGVSNPHFKLELDYLSPWSGFIHRFGEIADTTLQQIHSWQERETLRNLTTSLFAKAKVAHQMVNQVKNLVGPLERLEKEMKGGRMKGNENHQMLISSANDACFKILALARRFAQTETPDDRRCYPFSDVIQHAHDSAQDELTRFKINFVCEPIAVWVSGIPFDVLADVAVEILNNGKDSITDAKLKDGEITITIDDTAADVIRCHISDNGPGVPLHVIPHLFERPLKSTKSYGSGHGLYYSAHVLKEFGSNIVLTHPGKTVESAEADSRTVFTLCFPKSNNEQTERNNGRQIPIR
ncbi:MAG TPA: HAMP domain-containing sensor histidine kinase, partial [Anaerolineales bacterium]|nr:HAMP domain-containing sensor histidine kinase [Anaerolineales bacterium]